MSEERHPHINAVQFICKIQSGFTSSLRDKDKLAKLSKDKKLDDMFVDFVAKVSEYLDEAYS